MNPSSGDSKWSTDTTSPACVANLSFLVFDVPLVRQAFLVSLPYMHDWHTGMWHFKSRLGSTPFSAILIIFGRICGFVSGESPSVNFHRS
jgi:hypothetical protein